MISKRQVTAGSALAPLAIIDGTHLILLPTSGLSQERDGELTVPALPLKAVPSLIGKTIFDNTGKTCAAEWEGRSDEHSFERIRLDATDLIDDANIIRSTTVATNGKAGIVKIYSEQSAQHDLTINRSDDNTLDVHLSCSLDSLSNDRRIDSFHRAQIYGDSINGLLHDYGASSRVETTRSHFEMRDAGSCLVEDFLGLGGHQQALVIPLLEDDFSKNLQHNETADEEMFQESCNILIGLLQKSALADGHYVLLAEGLEHPMTTILDNHVISISLSPVSLNNMSMRATEINLSSGIHVDHMDIDSRNEFPEGSESTKDPEWLNAIKRTIEHRVSKKQNETFQIEKSNQICEKVVTCGRETLHKAVRLGFSTNNNMQLLDREDPYVVRLRYGMQPRCSMDSNRISVAMDLEVDVYLPETQIPYDHSPGSERVRAAEEPTSCESFLINDFYVSCLLCKTEESSANISKQITCENIRTSSGLVPVLHSGECVTVLATVYFTNMNMSFGDSSKRPFLEVSIQGCWINKTLRAQTDVEETQHRQGTILCTLQLSGESILLSSPINSNLNGGRCITNRINFIDTSSDDERYKTTAIFEHREPSTLSVDISSSSAAALQDPKIWTDLVSYLNDRIGVSSHIDLYWKKEDPCLKLSVFGSNQEERAGMLCYASFSSSLLYYHTTQSIIVFPCTCSYSKLGLEVFTYIRKTDF